jgi:integrase/recombinase XerC
MLEKQINGFIAYCKVSGFKDKSIESLSINLNKFKIFLDKIHVRSIKKITYRHLLCFVADFQSPSIHTKKARVWALRQFFHFLKLQGLVDENIATAIPYPKIEKTVPQFLTIDEYNKILSHCCQKAYSRPGYRDLVIILMLGLLGLRTGTIISLNIQDVDIFNGLVWVREKGNQKRIMVMPKILCQALDKHINSQGERHGPLFLSTRCKRISPRSLQDMFRSISDNAGIDKHLHTHLFRHTAATHLNKVAGTTITQFVLGHSRRENTLKYTHLNPDQYAVYMKKHPFMNI